MALLIQTTGLENYAPGGEARIKVLNIGGPGVGKTRWASFFPKPIYADCEAGLASVADRRVPYVGVRTSTDMIDLLNHVKLDNRLPKDRRTVETVVIDTLDAYQRKLKNEWMEVNRKEAFTGWEAWGWLSQKMNLLLTRLLNLDVNVIVNVHYKDKTTKDDVTGLETHELMLQLSGDIGDTAYNDFDLVGWTGVYWATENGERVQKRGITFKPTPDKPMLKDRLHVTPEWLPIAFDDSDYLNLFSRISAKVEALAPSETVGQIESTDETVTPNSVVAPDALVSGPVPPQPTPELPLAQLDKPALMKKARELGITTLPTGTPIKNNTLKGELIAAIEAHQTTGGAAPTAAPPVVEAPAPSAEPAAKSTVAAIPRQASAPAVEQVAEGLVNKTTGELLEEAAPLGEAAGPVQEPAPEPEPTPEDAVATVADKLGGQVIEETPAASAALDRQHAAQAEKTAAKPATEKTCDECGTDISPASGENQDYVKLAWIKYRKKLCQEHYLARKNG